MPCTTFIFYALLLLPFLTSAFAISPSFPYGSSKKVRGVNLGGWLVLEPWITPSIFDQTNDSRVVDEYTFGKYVPVAKAKSVLTSHWNTFITEQDFIAIATAGLNHVRLPIGYWAFDISAGEPYHQGQGPYLTKAIGWAKSHGIKVIIDYHGAPGSQNGFDNSGHLLSYPGWQSKQSNIARSSAIIKTLAAQFSDQTDVVTAIAPLNEPAGFHGAEVMNAVKQYWLDSYAIIRYPFGSSKKGNLIELIHDAFQPLSSWNGWQAYPKYDGVAIDTHICERRSCSCYKPFTYNNPDQMFSNSLVALNSSQHIQNACSYKGVLSSLKTLWIVVGEWVAAPNDCAKYLNGRGVGARYDGTYPGSSKVGNCSAVTGSMAHFSTAYKSLLRQMFEAQATVFEQGSIGWVYWTWKTESADEWSYSKGLAGGWIPRNPAERKYPNACG